MKQSITRQLAAALTACAAMFAGSYAQAAESAETLWFADSHVTAFYAVDEADHRLVLVTEPGPQGDGEAARTERRLSEGERIAISLNGHGLGAFTTTLEATRVGQTIEVKILTTPHAEVLARQY